MSLNGSAGIALGGRSSTNFSITLASQKKVEDKTEKGEEASGNVVLTGLKTTSSSSYYTASKGELLQDALLANAPSKQKNLISGLFVSLLPETSRYLQAQLDGLKMQNEFASQMNGVLQSAIMNSRAGKSSAFLERTINEAIEQTGDKKIHEEAEEDFKKADEELTEEIESKANEDGAVDLAATEGADAVRKDIEQRAEEVVQPESQSEQEGVAEAQSVQDAIEVETERSATASNGDSGAPTEASLQAVDVITYTTGQTLDSSSSPPAGTYVNTFI